MRIYCYITYNGYIHIFLSLKITNFIVIFALLLCNLFIQCGEQPNNKDITCFCDSLIEVMNEIEDWVFVSLLSMLKNSNFCNYFVYL